VTVQKRDESLKKITKHCKSFSLVMCDKVSMTENIKNAKKN
jgi:hypothetical protein